MTYFKDCSTLEQVKAEYKRLAKKLHPDLGGSKEAFQQLQDEYQEACRRVRYSGGKSQQQDAKDIPEDYMHVINKIITLDGIDIELCGKWIWVSGNTFPVRDALKAAGFRWSKNKRMWYWRPITAGDYHKRGKPAKMSSIRNKYGSEKITAETDASAVRGKISA